MSDHAWHLYSNGGTDVPPNVTHLLIASNVIEVPRDLCDSHEFLQEIRFEHNSICHTIEMAAFYNCRGLISVRLPRSVQCIQRMAFQNCPQLRSVTLDDDDKMNLSLDNVAVPKFPGYHPLCFFGASRLTEVYLAEGIRFIGRNAFSYCRGLARIRFATTVQAVDVEAFQHCVKLETVVLNHGLSTIEKGAFNGCESLRAIRIPSSVEYIGDSAFINCKRLYSVEMEHSVTRILQLKTPFRGCSKLSVISIPPYTAFRSRSPFDRWCTAMATIFPEADPTLVRVKTINRFTNHRLLDLCYNVCHEEDVVDMELLDETILQCRFSQLGMSGTCVPGINPLHILASSARPRRNLFHAILDRLPFQLLFREDKIGVSPLMLLTDNPSAEGQELLLSVIPKLVSLGNSQMNAY